MKVVKFALLFQFISLLALAQVDHGNGGGGIICQKTKVEIADFYVARTTWPNGFNLKMPTADTWQKKAFLLAERLRKLNPTRADLYEGWLQTFESESRFVTNQTLPLIDDLGVIAKPQDCDFVQIILQQTPTLQGETRYTINKDIWDLMDADNQGALVIHELVWREIRDQIYVHQDAKYVRYFVASLAADTLSSMSLREYIQFLQNVRFEKAQTQTGVLINLPICTTSSVCENSTVNFWDNNTISEAHTPAQFMYMPWRDITLAKVYLPANDHARFLANGEPENFYVTGTTWQNSTNPNSMSTQQVSFNLVEKNNLIIVGVLNPFPAAVEVTQKQIGSELDVVIQGANVFANDQKVAFVAESFTPETPNGLQCNTRIEFEGSTGKVINCN